MSNSAKNKNLSEIAWLDKLSKGNPAALRYFYERYAGKIVAFAEKLLYNREDAEDITHTVFINLWEQRLHAVEIKSVDSYLFRMTRNAVIDFHRQRTLEKAYLQQTREAGETAEHDDSEFENDSRLLNAIDQLTEPQRTIIYMSRFEGLSYQEIGLQLNISPHTVHYHISQALIKLRNSLTCLIVLLASYI